MKGHILRISSTSVLLDGSPILTSFPSHYKLEGVFTVTFNAHGKILQPHRELGKDLKVLHFHFAWHGIFMQVNQWTNEEEGHFVNLLVEMDAIPNMDGHCGNFNGNPADDDRLEIRKRLGTTGVAAGELYFHTKTAVVQVNRPDINNCPAPQLDSAKALCKKKEHKFIPSMSCLVDVCFGGKQFASEA